jgi:hypothetical protein
VFEQMKATDVTTKHPHLDSETRGNQTIYYYRRKHGPRIRIRDEYDTPEFWDEYHRLRISDEVQRIVEKIDDLVDLLRARKMESHAVAVNKMAADLIDTDRDISFELRKPRR